MSAAGEPQQPAARPLVVLATRNAHKVSELRTILADVLARTGHELVAAADLAEVPEVVETGVTFAANALLKARSAATATGLPALADDSGLAVDVLGGSPGVFSARWSGTDGPERDAANTALLLAQLADVPDEHRAAGFVCAAALALPNGAHVVREGTVRGSLAREPRGSGGFGYDPVLVLPDGRTLAELTPQEKHAVSHRGAAFRALAQDVAHALQTRPTAAGGRR